MRVTRLTATVGVAATVALGLAACGSSSSSKPAATDDSKPTVSVPKLTGTQTAVTLDTATIAALKGLGVTVAGNGIAKSVTLADGAAVAFPITGGHVDVYPPTHKPAYVTGEIDHVGSGITLTVKSKELKLTDFVVDPGTSMLSATINGSGPSTPVFFLDGSNLKITGPTNGAYMLDGTRVELLPAAASLIDKYFGVPDGTVPPMAEIGIAHIVAS